MKILHTSDWHLGKRLMDRERLAEQVEALDEIASICEDKDVELVLIAGDVFDTFLPPAEAEEIFFHALKKITGGKRAVVAVSGNHDDGIRLSASAPIAAEQAIYLFGGRGQTFPIGQNLPVRAVEAGENYVVIENRKGERVYINALPYPNEARLHEEKTEETYAEKTLRWILAGDEHYDKTMPHILLTHIFTAGGKVSESERDISLGGARSVPVSNLPQFGYTALGHLHKRQRIAPNAYYSGSLLQYSFDEAGMQKEVILLETSENDVTIVEEIPLSAGKQLVRLEANDIADALELLTLHAGKFVELSLHLTAPLTASETQALREANDGLISIIPLISEGHASVIERRSTMNEEELFVEFCRMQFGEEPAADLKEAFLQLVGGES